MKRSFKDLIIRLLDSHRIMTIATNRPDGWPQATVVGYMNDGLVIYFFAERAGQKVQNISRDERVSIALGKDTPKPLDIKGLSLAATALVVDDASEVDHAFQLQLKRFPEYRVLPKPNPREIAMVRVTPQLVSIIDYEKGFGHSDLVRVSESDLEEFVESRRHHWAGQPVS